MDRKEAWICCRIWCSTSTEVEARISEGGAGEVMCGVNTGAWRSKRSRSGGADQSEGGYKYMNKGGKGGGGSQARV